MTNLNETAPVTDESLFWEAYSFRNLEELANTGADLDARIGELNQEFHVRTFDSKLSEVAVEEVRVLYALQHAQRHINRSYGLLTGSVRKGCAMGASSTYAELTPRW